MKKLKKFLSVLKIVLEITVTLIFVFIVGGLAGLMIG